MALRTRPMHMVLAAALLAAAVACKGPQTAPARPTARQHEAACAPVWQKVHAEIDASSACTADWECRQVQPEYLGCDAWANLDYRLSEGRLVELENACAAISFAPKCGEQVGACKAGRCAWKRPVRDEQACQGASALLVERLAQPVRCTESAECTVVESGKELRPAPADWSRRFGREWAAVKEACTRWPVAELRGYLSKSAICAEGGCSVLPLDPGRPANATRPLELEKGCIGRATRMPRNVTAIPASLKIKFAVSPRGVPHHFELVDEPSVTAQAAERVENARRQLLIALAEGISQCAFEPGRSHGEPIEIWLVLPISFRP